jgi:tRNA/rRNA methyltransferase
MSSLKISAPAVILADPQMGENIGAAARVMCNFGLSDLRIVRPRDGWPSPIAQAMATRGAAAVLNGARVFDRVAEAVAGLTRVFAATARDRYMQKAIVEPEACIAACEEVARGGAQAGLLFGSERAGLANDDVALADTILTIPCNPDFTSLNLAQSVAVLAYEWQKLMGGVSVAAPALADDVRMANKEDLIGLFEQLEAELDRVEFLYPPKKRPAMIRNIRNMWHRANLTYQDVQTIRGMITALTRTPKRRGETSGLRSEKES